MPATTSVTLDYAEQAGFGEAWVFEIASAKFITNYLKARIRDTNNEDAPWVDCAFNLLECLTGALVYLRDNNDVCLTPLLFRECCVILNVIELAKDKRLPESLRAPINKYLENIPGYVPGALKQHDAVLRHHGQIMSVFYRCKRSCKG